MEPILMIVLILMFVIIGILIFNYKLNISMINMAYIIVGITIISIFLLVVGSNTHPECDLIINHNNMTLQMLQDKCYQYINF